MYPGELSQSRRPRLRVKGWQGQVLSADSETAVGGGLLDPPLAQVQQLVQHSAEVQQRSPPQALVEAIRRLAPQVGPTWL
jgi:hypothetical protein